MIERKIVIGLITSKPFLKTIRPYWRYNLLESKTAETISKWCIEYFDEYKDVPYKNFETLFWKKAKNLDTELAEEIESSILPGLNKEFIDNPSDVDYLTKETIKHLNKQNWLRYSEEIQGILLNSKRNQSEEEKLKELNDLKSKYSPISLEINPILDLSDKSILKKIKTVLTSSNNSLFKFPKQLQKFWGDQFAPGGFIGFLAPEKRGKTWLLLYIAKMAMLQGRKVALFQAGDMSEDDFLRREITLLMNKPILEKYTKEKYVGIRDCIRNQMDSCDKSQRESTDNDPLFMGLGMEDIYKLNYDELLKIVEGADYYKPCCNCEEYDELKLGSIYLKKLLETEPVMYRKAQQFFNKNIVGKKRDMRISTHANGTLSVSIIENLLSEWEEEEWCPDVILIDYADLLVTDQRMEFRHQQNHIWKGLRKVSQTPRKGVLPLVITPTQSDSDSYETYRLKTKNFSEDKRKFAHCTSFYGLNQDPDGRDKSLGLLRINELLLREGDFSVNNEVTLIQNLNYGQPVTGCYFSKI